MENFLQSIAMQLTRTNDLLEQQHQSHKTQQRLLNSQSDALMQLSQRLAQTEDLLCQVADILDRDLLSLLDQPLLLKQDVMEKLDVVDSTYRKYVYEEKLRPMVLGKIDYYFARDFIKDLRATRYRRNAWA